MSRHRITAKPERGTPRLANIRPFPDVMRRVHIEPAGGGRYLVQLIPPGRLVGLNTVAGSYGDALVYALALTLGTPWRIVDRSPWYQQERADG